MGVFGRESAQNRAVSSALLSDLGPGMHPRVSIRGGQFALVDAAGIRYGAPVLLQNTPKGQKLVMLGIIVGSNPKKSRVFFGGKYDPDNPGPPDCFSDNGTAPSASASSPQARTCGECTWSKWGSDTSQLTGKATKACSEKKKIAIIVVNDTTGLSYELQIPPATLKNMATYAATLAQSSPPGEQRKADVSDMITAFSFVSGQTGILEFAPFAWITSAYVDASGTLSVAVDANQQPLLAADGGDSVGDRIDEIWESHELDDILGLKDTPWQPPALTGPLPGMAGGQEAQQARLVVAQRQSGLAGAQAQNISPVHAHGQAQQNAPATVGPYSPPLGYVPPAAVAPQPAAPQQQAVVPAPATPTPSRGRKPRQAVGSAPAPQEQFRAATPAQPADIPDFLRRSQQPGTAAPASTPVPTRSGPAADPTPNSGASYGMVEAGAPPSGIENVLDAVFKLNTSRA